MDFLQAGGPPLLIQNALNLTTAQMQAALAYLQTHSAETEAEYQTVLAQTDADRVYWQERNRERLEATPPPEPDPKQEELRARLAAWKARSEAAA